MPRYHKTFPPFNWTVVRHEDGGYYALKLINHDFASHYLVGHVYRVMAGPFTRHNSAVVYAQREEDDATRCDACGYPARLHKYGCPPEAGLEYQLHPSEIQRATRHLKQLSRDLKIVEKLALIDPHKTHGEEADDIPF